MNKLTLTTKPSTPNLSANALMEKAEKQTGLSDWGDDDFKTGLNMLLQACKQEANLSIRGQQWLEGECLRWLSNRLRIQQTLVQYPEISKVAINNPLFVIGLPRSGTTFLHRLLSQTPGARIPLHWELWQPAPPPQPETYHQDPRITEVKTHISNLETWFPSVFKAHYFNPTAPEECYLLFQNTFCCFGNTFFFHIPSYQNWLYQFNLLPAYQYYKLQLQILSWRCSGAPWILKHQDHLLSLDTLLAVFPNARIVHIHRHPRQVIASLCNLQSNVMNIWRDTPLSPEQAGEIILNRWFYPLQQAIQMRTTLNSAQFFDVQYRDLLTDPIGTIQQIYTYFGVKVEPTTFERMQHWLDNNPQHKHGKHNYNLDTFGLKPAQIDEKYADYIERFRIKA